MGKIIALAVVLFSAKLGEGLHHPLSPETDLNIPLSQCILEISKTFFPRYFQTVTYLYSPHENIPASFNHLIISKLMEETRWALKVQNTNSRHHEPYSQGYFVATKTYSELPMFSKHRFDRIIVLLQDKIENTNKAVQQISEMLWKKNVTSAIILLQDIDKVTSYKVYMFSAYCGTYKQFKIDRCSLGILQYNTLFLERVNRESFTNCTLKVSYSILEPFVIKPYHKKHKRNGVEVNLLNAAASVLNIKLLYEKSTKRGHIENGTLLGDFKSLYDGSIDFVLGGYSEIAERLRYLHPSPSYINVKLMFCVPHKLVNDDLRHIANIFSTQVWCCIALSYLVTTCGVWYFSNYDKKEATSCKNFPNCLQNNFAILVGLTAHLLPRTTKVRFLTGMCIILGFHLNQIYSSYLTSILTSPNYKEKYSSVSEICKDNLHVYVRNLARWYLTDEDYRSMPIGELRGKFDMCKDTVQCLKSVIVHGNSTLIMRDLEVKYQLKTHKFKKSSIHCKDLDLYYMPIAIFMRKGSPFAEAFSSVMDRIISAGFMIKWMREVSKETHTNLRQKEQNYIRFENLKPILQLFMWSYVFCILVFTIEINISKKKKIQWV